MNRTTMLDIKTKLNNMADDKIGIGPLLQNVYRYQTKQVVGRNSPRIITKKTTNVQCN